MRCTRNQLGHGFVEILVAAVIGSGIIIGGLSVYINNEKSQKAADVQGRADRALADGLRMMKDISLIKTSTPPLPAACLAAPLSPSCAQYETWQSFRNLGSPNAEPFDRHEELPGGCSTGQALTCIIERKMDFHWVCSSDGCHDLETRVRVSSTDLSYKTKVYKFKIPARLLGDRAELQFRCFTLGRPMIGIDHDGLTDICGEPSSVNCEAPIMSLTPDAGHECSEGLVSECSSGYQTVSLQQGGNKCVP